MKESIQFRNLSDGGSSFSLSVPFLYGDLELVVISFNFPSNRKVVKGKYVISYMQHNFFCLLKRGYVHLTYCPVLMLYFCDKFFSETLFTTHPINLVVEKISRNEPILQTPITYCYIKKNPEKNREPFQHNNILTLMKFGVPFFRIDIICMI